MEHKDKAIIEFLKHRTGKSTIAKIKNGSLFTIWNIVFGYDMGDEYAHITTNINPGIPGAEIDILFTSDIVEFIDLDNNNVISLPIPANMLPTIMEHPCGASVDEL